MKTVRIFISSPGDVHEEREKARRVIEQLERRYAGRLRLVPVLWEDLPLQADMSFQQGIDLVLSQEQGVDIAVFILWSRLGSPLGSLVRKPDGSNYRSGTEREFDLVLQARQQSVGKKPAILAYVRQDEAGFKQIISDKAIGDLESLLHQRKLVDQFIREQFHDPQTGTNQRAYHTFQEPISFATRLREHLRQQLDALLPEHADSGSRWERPPFQGLEPFELEHAEIFFGREQAVCEVQLALNEQAAKGSAFVLILGASGSGKSSLARAGVLASFVRYNLDSVVSGWRRAILTPGAHANNLCLGLAQALAGETALPELRGDDRSLPELGEALAKAPELAFNLRIKGALKQANQGKPGETRLLLLVDQMEELFTHPAVSKGDITVFLQALAALARSGSVWVLATMRSDFYSRCQEYPVLLALKEGKGQFDLLPPGPSEIRRIITEPVWLAGLRYEQKAGTGESLDQRILDDAAKSPEALPLLEYLLRELYERRSEDGLLTFAQYEQLGGVEGALGCRAEAVFTALPEEVRRVLPEVLRELITLNEEDDLAIARQRAPFQELTYTLEKRALVDAFLNGRLFVAGQGPEGEPVVHVAHEALVRGWSRATDWVRDNREFLRARKRVGQAHARWQAEGQSAEFLLPAGKPLAEGEALLLTHGLGMGPDLSGYIQSSAAAVKAREGHRLNRLRMIAAGFAALSLLTAVGGVMAWTQRQEARRAKDTAQHARQTAEGLITSMLFDLRDKLQQVGRLNILDEVSQKAEDYFKHMPETEASDQHLRKKAIMFQNRGTVLMAQGKLKGAREAFQQGMEISRRLAQSNPTNADIQNDLSESHRKLGDAAALEGDLKAAVQAYEQALGISARLAQAYPTNAHAQRSLGASYLKLGIVAEQKGDLQITSEAYQKAMEISRRLAEANPTRTEDQVNLGVSFGKVGDVARSKGDLKGARAAYQQGLEITRRLAKADAGNAQVQRALKYRYQDLGDLAIEEGDNNEAREAYQQGLDISRCLAQADPTNTEAQQSLGISYNKIGNLLLHEGNNKKASEAYQRGLEISRRLAQADPTNADAQRDLSISHLYIGQAAMREGDLNSARVAFSSGAAILTRLTEADPTNADAQRDLSVSYKNLGNAAMQQKDFKTAREAFQQSIGIRCRLTKTHPTNTQAQRELAVNYALLGTAAKQEGDPNAARMAFRQGLDILTRLTQASPTNLDALRLLSISHINLGDLAIQEKDFKTAREAYQQAIDYRDRLMRADPADAHTQRNLSFAYTRLGDGTKQEGDLKTARVAFQKAMEILVRLTQVAPTNYNDHRDLGISYINLAELAKQEGDVNAAREAYRQCIEIRRKLAQGATPNPRAERELAIPYYELGNLSKEEGDLKTAREAYQQYLEINRRLSEAEPDNRQTQRNLGIAYDNLGNLAKREGNLVAAREAYEQYMKITTRLVQADATSAEVQRDLSISHDRLGDVAHRQGDIKAAREAYQRGMEIRQRLAMADPTNIQAQRDLAFSYEYMGTLCMEVKDYGGAKSWFEQELHVGERMVARGFSTESRFLASVLGKLTVCSEQTGDLQGAENYQLRRVGELRFLLKRAPSDSRLARETAEAYGTLAWYDLLDRKPQEAIAAVLEGLRIDPAQEWMKTNLAHGYLFDGQYEKARDLYLANRTNKLNDKQTFAEAVLDDFRRFREKGLNHPDMEKIEKLLRDSAAAK